MDTKFFGFNSRADMAASLDPELLAVVEAKAQRVPFAVCSPGKRCTGYDGRQFSYEDGSRDEGQIETKCTAEVGAVRFGWFEPAATHRVALPERGSPTRSDSPVPFCDSQSRAPGARSSRRFAD